MDIKRKAIATLLATFASTAVFAVEFNQVQLDKSSVSFSFQQMGVNMEGNFKKFNSQFYFDPNALDKSKASFEIDLASIDIGSAEANTEVRGKSWFNVTGFPTAKFVTSGIKSNGANKYDVSGVLSIKGQNKNITIPVTFSQQGKNGVFNGSFTIKRGDFKIGEGEWAKYDLVANDVQVKISILTSSK